MDAAVTIPDWLPARPDLLDEADAHLSPVTAHLFAAHRARRVLPLFERVYPGDGRVRHAIDTRERFAFGLATHDEWDAASRDAAVAAWLAGSEVVGGNTFSGNTFIGVRHVAIIDASNAAWMATSDAAREAARAVTTTSYEDGPTAGRLLSLFLPPSHSPGEAVRGIAARWVDLYFAHGTDCRRTRAVLADALQDDNHEYDWRVLALQELPAWAPGMWPMTPDVVRQMEGATNS